MTDIADELLECGKQILVNVYLRTEAQARGITPDRLDDNARAGIMERWRECMTQEFIMLEELLRQARVEGASGIYQGLRESVLDPDVVDQVIEHSKIVLRERG